MYNILSNKLVYIENKIRQKEYMNIIVCINTNLDWAKGRNLSEAIANFKKVHKYKFDLFDDEGNENPVVLVLDVKDIDDVYVDDVGQLHYKDGCRTIRL